jgi:uncharacterized protein (TIGR02246 family)
MQQFPFPLAAICFVALHCVPLVVCAEEKSPEMFDAFAKAFDSGDAESLANLWTENGILVNLDTGDTWTGRTEIQSGYKTLFEQIPKRKIQFAVVESRKLSDSVIQSRGIARTSDLTSNIVSESTYIAALTLQKDGRWLLDSVHEKHGVDDASAGVAADPLSFLDPLIGQWRDENVELDVLSIVKRSESGKFVTRDYTVTDKNKEIVDRGTIIVAWDAGEQRAKAWQFSMDGTFGEGFVSPLESGVSYRIEQTLPDGSHMSSLQIVEIKDENTLSFRSVDQLVDGQSIEDGKPVTARRVKQEGSAAPE